jgi:phage-related protein
MALDTFTPPVAPTLGTSNSPEVSIYKTSFGDGYTQSSPKGLNNIRQTLSLKWDVLTLDQAQKIEAFLVKQGGYSPFYYAAPLSGVTRKWTCEQWTVTYAGPAKVTATFKENFSLRN